MFTWFIGAYKDIEKKEEGRRFSWGERFKALMTGIGALSLIHLASKDPESFQVVISLAFVIFVIWLMWNRK